jgi:antirestriction protein
MKIYAACLASYNSGILHGAWIDVCSEVDDMQAAVAKMLRESPCPNVKVTCEECEGAGKPYGFGDSVCEVCKGAGKVNSAEEWAIHDYDGFPNLGEYPGLQAVADMAAIFEEFDHMDSGDLQAILDDFGTDGPTYAAEQLRDNFCGIYDTFRDYSDKAGEESLGAHDVKSDSFAYRYFDWQAWERDLAFDMRVIDCPSGVAVFYSN